MVSYQIARHHIQEDSDVDDNITSHEIQEVYLHADTSSTNGSNKRVCHIKLQYICFHFERHTITQANVHHTSFCITMCSSRYKPVILMSTESEYASGVWGGGDGGGGRGGVVCGDEGYCKTCRHVSQALLSQRNKRCFPWPNVWT
jgi:hypothetical protein